MSETSPQLKRSNPDKDQILIDRIKGGDQSAMAEIMMRYRARIYSKTYQMLRNHQDAEEVTQDAFINALRGLVNFRGDSAFATWLHRIAINLARKRYHYWSHRRRDTMVSLDAPLGVDTKTTLGEVIPEARDSGYGEIESEDLSDRIQIGLDRISCKHREILILRSISQVSYEEISKILTISVGTVKSRIARARENLRAEVGA